MTAFSIMVIVGWVGALTFLLLFVLHPSTRRTRKDHRGRVFWMFILADSAVMLMIYTSGLLNMFLPDWPLKDAFRALLGISAICVVWWRVALFMTLNVGRKRADHRPADSDAD